MNEITNVDFLAPQAIFKIQFLFHSFFMIYGLKIIPSTGKSSLFPFCSAKIINFEITHTNFFYIITAKILNYFIFAIISHTSITKQWEIPKKPTYKGVEKDYFSPSNFLYTPITSCANCSIEKRDAHCRPSATIAALTSGCRHFFTASAIAPTSNGAT